MTTNHWLRILTAGGFGGADPEPPEGGTETPPPAAAAAADEGHQAIAYARRLGIRSAIGSATDKDGKQRQWADVDTVVELLNDAAITIDFATGEITGVTEQLDDLATKRPFLLKTAAQQQPPASPGGYGTPPASGNSGDHPLQKDLAHYAEIPAYRDALSHLL